MCQGVLSTTLAQVNSRVNNRPFAYTDYRLRPYPGNIEMTAELDRA